MKRRTRAHSFSVAWLAWCWICPAAVARTNRPRTKYRRCRDPVARDPAEQAQRHQREREGRAGSGGDPRSAQRIVALQAHSAARQSSAPRRADRPGIRLNPRQQQIDEGEVAQQPGRRAAHRSAAPPRRRAAPLTAAPPNAQAEGAEAERHGHGSSAGRRSPSGNSPLGGGRLLAHLRHAAKDEQRDPLDRHVEPACDQAYAPVRCTTIENARPEQPDACPSTNR